MFLCDLILIPLAAYLACALRFEGTHWTPAVLTSITVFAIAVLPAKLVVLWRSGMYRRLWRYASVAELRCILLACGASSVLALVLGAVILPAVHLIPQRVPLSVLVLDAFFSASVIAIPRFLVRTTARRRRTDSGHRPGLIIGAGLAGAIIARELATNPTLGIAPVGFLDDDASKQGLHVHDLPVLGRISDLESIASRTGVSDIIIAMPSAPGKVIRQIVRNATSGGLRTRTMPGMHEILSGEQSSRAIRPVEIQDLLRREPIVTDSAQVASLVRGHTVLVTGAGGSIGSELCRQLARLAPAQIVVLGRGENSIFQLQQAMARDFPSVHVEPVIADVRDEGLMQRVFTTYRPYSVFHAAAHKHVPLMEASIREAVLNNVVGTTNVVHCAALVDTAHFVLVSTDKAVRPTSVMGATKRIAELMVHEMALDHPAYVSVRFGNVLGSRGSVVPTFLQQIAQGGPVTITHPDMTRYFMMIPEAVQLVLQAAALGRGGEVFVLDMGEPVRILDLAHDLIRLSGLEIGTDVDIQFSGARPGEKLYEELFFGADVALPTAHAKIMRAIDARFPADGHAKIERLVRAARAHRPPELLRELIADILPEYAGGQAPCDVIATPARQERVTHKNVEPATAGSIERWAD